MIRTQIALHRAREESIMVWIEDTKEVELPFKDRVNGPNMFGTVGGALCTNTGMKFSKHLLQQIIDNMTDDGLLLICSPNNLVNAKEFFQENK